MRFNQEKLSTEGATDDFIYGTQFQGIHKPGRDTPSPPRTRAISGITFRDAQEEKEGWPGRELH
jgi:hypothetical protein